MPTDRAARWRRARELLEELLEHPAEERARRLREAAGGDGELVAEVEELLSYEADDHFLESPVGPDSGPAGLAGGAADSPSAWVGQRLGPYEIRREIASGGMGSVFLAARADGAFEQRVAVKLIKRGMDTDSILRRFRQERQVLASLEHSGIARLIDGNAHTDGRPYLVMEYVEGRPIDRYCSEHDLDLRARIELFLEVCAAVQHAHERLVVHRDLKPANILVTEAGDPKLLDFGLAKLLTPDETERTYELTAQGERLLTPVYAAPEQVRGEAVTTATDVYALGVLLYELLSGVRPYELDGLPWQDVERLVCDVDPPPPSVARKRRSADPTTRRTRSLDGDLDTICLAALCKEPDRRYRSVARLADDLERYVEGLPIAARPSTLRYRVTKFVRRNRLLTGSVAALFAVLVASVVVVAHQARLARHALRETRSALANAAAVNDFMRGVVLAADPRDQGADVTVREAVGVASERALARLSGLPEADVRDAVGTAYRTLGDLHAAQDQLAAASEIRGRELGPEHVDTLSTLHELATAQRDLGRYGEAQKTIAQVVAGRTRILGADDPTTIQAREVEALVALDRGQAERAHELLVGVCAGYAEALGAADPSTLVAMKHLANTLRVLERGGEAARILEQVLEQQTGSLGPDHLDTLITRVDLATALGALGRPDEVEAHYRAALAGFEAQLPPEHLTRAITAANLAGFYVRRGRLEEARAIAGPLLDVCDEHLGADHPLTAKVRGDLDSALRGLGRGVETPLPAAAR